MNVGVSIENNMLYLVVKNSGGEKPSFYKSSISLSLSEKNKPRGYLLGRIKEEEIKNSFTQAEKIAITIPAAICFSKRIIIDSKLDRARPDYRAWVAHNQLPGELSNYIYGFSPLAEDRISGRIETLFFAAIANQFRPLFHAIAGDDNFDRVYPVPEYMSLAVVLRNAVGPRINVRAVMVNIGGNGVAAVIIKTGSMFSTRYFPLQSGKPDELTSDLEAYFLSVIDSDEKVEIFIAGGEKSMSFKPKIKARIKYNKMPAGFISALGSVEYISTGGICELPAGV
ncbi:MAG: hypothetical protein JSU85_02570 [Candidatus Zixiibacteriota bacterium]|nr:MAG: hypothetical protein JSU85_02570 [candidate division Zixibacteria bacterium]